MSDSGLDWLTIMPSQIPGSAAPGSEAADFARALTEFEEITSVYHVLPHERWVATRMLRNAFSPNPKPSRIKKKDGVIGCVSGGILYASAVPFAALVPIGLALLAASGGAPWAYVVVAVGIAGCFLGVLRALPAGLAGERYLKTGDWRPPRLAQKSSPPGPLPGSRQGSGTAATHSVPPPPPPPGPPSGPDADRPGGPAA